MMRFALTWRRSGAVHIIDFDGEDSTAFNCAVAAAVSMAETTTDPPRSHVTVFMGDWPEPDADAVAAAQERLQRAGARLAYSRAIREAAGKE